MEKLIPFPDSPRIEAITFSQVFCGEAKIKIESFSGEKFEIYFSNMYDFRQCVEVAFIGRNFETETSEPHFTLNIVENSEWIKSFIKSSDGVYGEREENYQHYILIDSIDTIIEVIATEPPLISKILPPQGRVRIADLVNSTGFSAVREKICLHYGENSLKEYRKLYSLLENMAQEFISDGDLTVYITAFRIGDEEDERVDDFDENDPSLDYDVSGYSPNEEIVYSIAASSYKDFLGYEVDEETMQKFSAVNILAHCLYEITFYGFQDNI